MTKLQHEIRINAPAGKVWNVLTDLEQVGHYNPLVASVKYISERRQGIGASRECQFKPKGFARERVTGVKELMSLSMEMYESEWPLEFMRWTNYLAASGGTTTVKTVTEYKLKFGILGALLDNLVMKRKFNKIMDELFASLKEYVESK